MGRDKTKIAIAETLCKMEETPGKGNAILNRFRYLGEFISKSALYCINYFISALLSFFS